MGVSSAIEVTVISNQHALGYKGALLKLNFFFLGVTQFQLVLFLHISKTDHLKDQRGLYSRGMKNLKRVG